jgi:sulfate/thiosulfate transport system substrate-binding protein
MLACLVAAGCGPQTLSLQNVSYDPTREFYAEFNQAFVDHWREQTGQEVTINNTHAGSSMQARAVIDGLEADVVTLALAYDIDAVAKAGLLASDWQKRLDHHSSPYTSTIVFLVRKGGKPIKDWDDLVKPGTSIITPHPKTSGGARWNYLAAWGYALKRELGDLAKLHDPKYAEDVKKAQAKAREFVTDLFRNVQVLDSGARGATMSFVRRGRDDALLAWENEAFLTIQEQKAQGHDDFEIVVPSVSILAEPPVAIVDQVVDRRGTRELAGAYLKYLYSPEGQNLAAKNFFRPTIETGVSPEYLERFPKLNLFTVDDVFGGWAKAQAEHFDDGGVFDQMYRSINGAR